MIRWLFLHHKCASLWTRAAVSQYAQGFGIKHIPALNSFRYPPSAGEVEGLFKHSQGLVLDDNAWPHEAYLTDCYDMDAIGEAWRGVNIIRDPRDLLVSAHWSHLYSHGTTTADWPELQPHRTRIEQMSLEDGLLEELNLPMTRWAIESILFWPKHRRVLSLDPFRGSFRQCLSDTVQWLWLDVPLDQELLDRTLKRLSFSNLSDGRSPGEEDNHHHYRHGVAGDWRRYFTPAVTEVFKYRYGQALIALGYELNQSWEASST